MLLLAALVSCPQTPPVNSQFNIEIIYLDNFPTQFKPFMEQVVQYWEKIIVADIADFNNTTNPADPAICNFTSEQVAVAYPLQTRPHIDDLILYVGMNKDINATDGIIANAGPCLVRSLGTLDQNLPFMSTLFFNKAYFDDYSTNKPELLKDATIHEVGHALGFGTVWDQFPGLYIKTPDSTPCGSNPEFTGFNAKREYATLGGTGNVPLKASSENGTCGHWSEKLFDREMMTPAPNPAATPPIPGQNNPVSRLTIASMQDLGYTVDYSIADNYSLPIADVNTGFDIEWFYSNDFPNELKPHFEAAAARWQNIITADIPNSNSVFKPASGDCNIPDEAPFSGVDDIIIYVGIIPAAQSAGPNGLKYRAEPCKTRAGSFLPEIAVIQYSNEYLPHIYASNSPESPSNATTLNFTRSIARALGFGTNWIKKGFISGYTGNGLCSSNVEYTGSNAVREAQLLGGLGNIIFRQQIFYIPNTPPEKCPELWERQRYLGELMGGGGTYSTNPQFGWFSGALSKVTFGAMQDLGYTVDYSLADPINLQPQLPTDPCFPFGCT